MKNTLIWASIFGLTSIILGAFGAHALKQFLTEQELASFLVGVRYQMYHALFLLFLGLFAQLNPDVKLKSVKNFIVIGVLLFSCSIYLLSFQDVLNVKMSFLGPVTPLGGLFMIIGWCVFLVKLITNKGG